MTDAIASKTLSSLNVAYSRATSDQLSCRTNLCPAAKEIYDIMKGKRGGKRGVYMSVAMQGMARDVHRALHEKHPHQKASTPLMKPRRLLNVLLITDGTTRTSGEIKLGRKKIDLK